MFPVLCDLDGVVWLANRPIDGSVDAIARLRAAGHRVLFVTNNSSAEVAVQEAALAAIGVPAEGDVLTSAQAAALLVAPGERAIACAGAGVVEALRRQGAIVLDAGDPAVAFNANEFDQRGLPFVRVVDGGAGGLRIDMGAFERQNLAGTLVVDTTADESDGDFSAGDLSLREAVELLLECADPEELARRARSEVFVTRFEATVG